MKKDNRIIKFKTGIKFEHSFPLREPIVQGIQYLGSTFKDKNGQELYEGCKFKFNKAGKYPYIAQVLWDDKNASFIWKIIESENPNPNFIGITFSFFEFHLTDTKEDFLNHIEIIK